jgi:hypothetical protein
VWFRPALTHCSCAVPYLIDPYSAILSYATSGDYHTTVEGVLNDTNPDQTEQVAARSQICLVFVGADSGEAYITVEGAYAV